MTNMEVVIISSTHFAERDDEQTGGLRLVPALENIEGELVPSVNCWEMSHNEDGTFSLSSYAPIDEHYMQNSFPSTPFPLITIDEENARDLLAFLQHHLEKGNR